jgi:hypothetical protein
MTGPSGYRATAAHAQDPRGPPPGAPRKRPPGPPPGYPSKRPPGPPRKRPAGPPPGYPSKRPPGAPPGPPRKRPAPPPAAEKMERKGNLSPPMIVFAVAFLVIALINLRFLLVGIHPFTSRAATWFPLGAMDMVLVLSFLLWPALAFWGAKVKQAGGVWVGTAGFLLVSLVFTLIVGPSPLGVQNLFFAGPFMLVGALWYSSRGY